MNTVGDVLYVLAGLIGIALVVIVLIDSWRVSLPEDRIHLGRNSSERERSRCMRTTEPSTGISGDNPP